MKVYLINFKLILCLLSLVIIGCATVPKASPELTSKAKKIVPPEGMALVYLIRPSNVGYAVRMNITCNNKIIGSTGGKQFIYIILEPGNYKFASNAENTHELPIVLEADKTYFIEQKVKMGWAQARTELNRVSEQIGRVKLKDCSLSTQVYELN